MIATYEPYEPLGEPVLVADGIWTVDGPVVPFAVGPAMIPCPTRMTVVRSESGGLLLHSPIALSSAVSDQLAVLGTVSCLVAPNSFHDLYLTAWADAFPSARVLMAAPRGPRAAAQPTRAEVIEAALPPPWDEVLAHVIVDGGAWVEIAFLHRASRTLILTDLIQNFEADRVRGRAARTLLRLGGAIGDPPRASLEMRLPVYLRGRRRAVRESLDAIRAWRPDRVLVTHGRQLEGSTASLLERAFAWA